jgi:hypothetical protein
MSTTNLFVELIVIGVSAFTWFVLTIFSAFGYAWVPKDLLFSPSAAVPILAVIYVLGIISDRIADTVFHWIWSDDLRESYFQNRVEYYNARGLILTRSERLSDLLEYGRSRLRICRGWAFNLILIAISFNTFLWMNLSDKSTTWPISIFGSLSLLVFAFAAWFAWQKLVKTEYRKTKEQAEFFAQLESEEHKGKRVV